MPIDPIPEWRYSVTDSVQIKCMNCKKFFTPYRKTHKYCSKKCRARGKYLNEHGHSHPSTLERKCKNCDKSFTPVATDNIFCCKRCGQEFHYFKAHGMPLPPPVETQRACSICGGWFLAEHGRQKYCSAICRREAVKKRKSNRFGAIGWDIPSGIVGAAIELIVATDLMLRKYHVFRAMSPQCPADLIVFKKDDVILRVEVRFANMYETGAYHKNIREGDDCDVYAFVTNDGEIHYHWASLKMEDWVP